MSVQQQDPRHDPNRVIRAPRGTELTAKSWLTEAPLRMLMNNLDPEVAEHRVAVGQGDPEVLPAATDRHDLLTGQGSGETGGAARVTQDRSRVHDVDAGDGATDDMALQARPDHLDLRELGHRQAGGSVGACAARISR